MFPNVKYLLKLYLKRWSEPKKPMIQCKKCFVVVNPHPYIMLSTQLLTKKAANHYMRIITVNLTVFTAIRFSTNIKTNKR